MPKITFTSLAAALRDIVGEHIQVLQEKVPNKYTWHPVKEGSKDGYGYSLLTISSRESGQTQVIFSCHASEAQLQLDVDAERLEKHNVLISYDAQRQEFYDLVFSDLLKLQEKHQNFILDFHREAEPILLCP